MVDDFKQDIFRVVVLGGGSAGMLAALAVKRKCPKCDITVVRSEAIPPIGVGESTTGFIPWFIHEYLQIPFERFFPAVLPIWKLGIRFEWGPTDRSHFNYVFDPCMDVTLHSLRKANAFYCLHDMEGASLNSALMDLNRSPVLPLLMLRIHNAKSQKRPGRTI